MAYSSQCLAAAKYSGSALHHAGCWCVACPLTPAGSSPLQACCKPVRPSLQARAQMRRSEHIQPSSSIPWVVWALTLAWLYLAAVAASRYQAAVWCVPTAEGNCCNEDVVWGAAAAPGLEQQLLLQPTVRSVGMCIWCVRHVLGSCGGPAWCLAAFVC
ncbi:hypothetical protein COO60DRAFT_489553 [Scenedesmus sp. NREL 46B-D3]|nr:hypothetical protein COO60DRAFT_489553 [Scenedesmus sp. NREL 46B-D3]